MKTPFQTRRDFIKKSTLASSSLILPYSISLDSFSGNEQVYSEPLEVFLFSKHLQFLNYDEMSEAAATMGFTGLDLTVRPKGHVLPSRVEDDLPKACEAMRKFGLHSTLMTTNILSSEDKESTTVLKTASNSGITHYRTGWLKYPEGRTILESQKIYGEQFKKLEIHNKELQLVGCYQNHAGNHVGAPIWDLLPILKATKNTNIGCQYDIRHAVVEGGSSWQLGLRAIHPYIKTIVIKDFKWGIVNGKWKLINTPLGEGMVDFDSYFSLLKSYNIKVPVSLHLEYDLGGAEHGATKISMDKKEIFRKMKKDLVFLQEAWQRAK